MQVYFCTVPWASAERRQMAEVCLDWWRQQDVKISVLVPQSPEKALDFQKARRLYAEHRAADKIYILADDDCLPSEDTDLKKAFEIVRDASAFGILSMWPSNATIHRWTPQDYYPVEDLQVLEHVSVGGVRFIRKGCIEHGWPELVGPGYDREHCDAMRRSGYRVGYLQHFRMTHLGEGKSSIWGLTSALYSKPEADRL